MMLKNMKIHIHESKSKNKDENATTPIEDNTIRVEEETGKKVEETLNTNEIKS
jgi:hypothetical protein